MKRAFLVILAVLAVAFLGISQSSTNVFPQDHNFNNPPNTFSSEKELRENLSVDESHEYEASGKKFFVCLSSFPSMGVTKERVTCWYHLPNSNKLVRVWDVRLVNAGEVKFDYETRTTRLSLIAVSNIEIDGNPMKGQPLASVVLTLLGTDMAVDF
ncbi:MAG TPA: hypothetical protein VHC44_07545 [Verrucomicrobiae bacterium]|nr:hypothetical protein [Verrucomicrobiae bacterium]